MKTILIAFIAIIALATGSNASAAKPWSFAGIDLGLPLASSNLPKCPTPVGDAILAWTPPTAICVTSVSQKSDDGIQIADLDGLTELHWQEIYGGYAALWNGQVITIRIHIDHDVFSTVEQILNARYGKPASITEDKVTSNGGAVVSSSKITWRESGNTIELTERCERIDRSCVDVSNDAMLSARIAARKNSAKADASVL